LKPYKVFMSFELPQQIRPALEGRILEKYPLSALTKAAEDVSSRYRREEGAAKGFQIKSEVEALSYLAARVPATYAASARVLAEVNKQAPHFNPRTLLDIGAGPGTASMAAAQTFDSLETSHLIEPNRYLKEVGQSFLSPYLKGAQWTEASVEKSGFDKDTYDLVLASYVLNELSVPQVGNLVKKLWAACSGILVIIEPGTPQGAGIIQQVRDFAITNGISILAPCPHSNLCPLKDSPSRWCHFAVRTSRSKLHKTLKGGDAGFEDEKFSYIILSRFPSVPPSHRLIGYPSGTKLREMQVCSLKGAETLQVSKSHPLHKLSKKLDWGDGFDI
jgi:ribosomal protein RSM22 (predicted rRNA methylase)